MTWAIEPLYTDTPHSLFNDGFILEAFALNICRGDGFSLPKV